MGQVAHAVFDGFPLGVLVVSIVTGFILILAANTAFNGFPVLGSILAKDGWLPRQLHTRGDRLAFSNGILIRRRSGLPHRPVRRRGDEADPALHRRRLRVLHAEPDRDDPALEPHPRLERDRHSPAHAERSRAINAVGATMSGTVLVVVLVTKFVHGAGLRHRRPWSCCSS